MNVSEISDEELNRAMIWLNPPIEKVYLHIGDRCNVFVRKPFTIGRISYLTDWSLTGPLMIKAGLNVFSPVDGSKAKVLKPSYNNDLNNIRAYDYNTLRAICECYLMINSNK